MYKIRHKETGLYFSTAGHRYIILLGHYDYDDKSFLSKYGKTWSTLRGPKSTFERLEKLYPDKFVIAKFMEVS